MNKKLNLIFDITILLKWGENGIYNCTINLLERFLKNENIKITLICLPEEVFRIKNFIREKKLKGKCSLFFSPITLNFLYFYSKLLYKKKKTEKNKQINEAKFIGTIIKIIKPLCKLLYWNTNCKKYDAYFSSVLQVPRVLIKQDHIKKYTLLHDVIPILYPDYYGYDPNVYDNFINVFDSLNHNDYYFANSEYTKKDFLKYCKKMDPNKVITTYIACDDIYKPKTKEETAKAKEKYHIPKDKKYAMSLCAIEKRKNIVRIIKTFIEFIKKNNIEDMVLVLGGPTWKDYETVIENTLKSLGESKDKVIETGFIDKEDLPSLYSGAEWFIYTSEYEGFGIPPLEAMNSGCPVITSNNTSLPEIVSDAGILIDCYSDEEHIKAYEKYYYDSDFRKECVKKGLIQKEKFSWDKTAKIMADIMLENNNKKDIREENSKKKVLIVRYHTLGDTIFALPFYKKIREIYGNEVQIDAIGDDKNYEILKACPYIDNIIDIREVGKAKPANIFRWIKVLKKYDIAYFLCTDILSFFSMLAGIKKRIGFRLRPTEITRFLTDEIEYSEEVHVTQTFLSLLDKELINQKIIEYENFFEKMYLDYKPIIKEKFITIHPIARGYQKNWPSKSWSELIQYITKELNLHVVILGSKKDYNDAEKLCISDKVHNYCGLITLGQTIQLINSSEMLIGNDSGLIHVASVLKKKSILLHGPTSMKHWGPINPNCKIISKNYPCSPCCCLMTADCQYHCDIPKCLETIRAAEVLNEVKKILE